MLAFPVSWLDVWFTTDTLSDYARVRFARCAHALLKSYFRRFIIRDTQN